MEAIMGFITYFGTISIFLGIPFIFLVLFLIHFFKIIKLKNKNEAVSKALIKKSKIYGVIFTIMVLFYALVMFLLSQAVANM